MNDLKRKWKRRFIVSLFLFIFGFTVNGYTQQLPNQPNIPRPLLHKLQGPQVLKQRLLAQKAQAFKKQSPAGNKTKCKNCDELLAKARKYGSVDIIIGFDIPNLPDATRLPKQDQPKVDQEIKEAISKAQEQLLKRLDSHKMRNIKTFDYTPGMSMQVDAAALEALIADPEVSTIEENERGDFFLPQSVPLIGAEQAFASGFTGAGYTIAIVDTGVDKSHPFLADKVIAEACFSTSETGTNPDGTPYTATSLCPNGLTRQIGSGAGVNCNLARCEHGTHLAGIASGNGVSFTGVAKDANIIAIQIATKMEGTDCVTSSPCITYYRADVIKALDYVYSLRNKYNIASVNLSLGAGKSTVNCDDSLPRFKASIDKLRAAGIATIAASGNNFLPNSLAAPACISTAISVGATTKSDTVAGYSNSASFLNLLAPGGDGTTGSFSAQCAEGTNRSLAS
jgi:subtilisin family serine protease